MPESARRSRPLATFLHPVRVEVHRPGFEPLASLEHLDVEKLDRAARAEFEVGYFGTGQCRALVRAVVRRGLVTELVVDPCPGDEPTRASPELVRLLDAARRRTTRRGRADAELPVPVADFVRNAARITVQTIVCIRICFFGVCFVCCQMANDPGQYWCGRELIVKS